MATEVGGGVRAPELLLDVTLARESTEDAHRQVTRTTALTQVTLVLPCLNEEQAVGGA